MNFAQILVLWLIPAAIIALAVVAVLSRGEAFDDER